MLESNEEILAPWLMPSWNHLKQYQQQERLPSGLLIEEETGIGAEQLATYFAQTLLCENTLNSGRACGICTSCLLMNSETHPDFIRLTPEAEGKPITVDQIRHLSATLVLKPQYDRQRIAIITPANQMNASASNALLKTLEEPTERTTIILIKELDGSLPATIKSRCQKLLLAMPAESAVMEWLKHQISDDQKKENLQLILESVNGAPYSALNILMSGDKKLSEAYCQVVQDWLAAINNEANLLQIAEEWEKLTVKTQTIYSWLSILTADIIKIRLLGKNAEIATSILHTHLTDSQQKLDVIKLYSYLDLLTSRQQQDKGQINTRLVFEELLIRAGQLM